MWVLDNSLPWQFTAQILNRRNYQYLNAFIKVASCQLLFDLWVVQWPLVCCTHKIVIFHNFVLVSTNNRLKLDLFKECWLSNLLIALINNVLKFALAHWNKRYWSDKTIFTFKLTAVWPQAKWCWLSTFILYILYQSLRKKNF